MELVVAISLRWHLILGTPQECDIIFMMFSCRRISHVTMIRALHTNDVIEPTVRYF